MKTRHVISSWLATLCSLLFFFNLTLVSLGWSTEPRIALVFDIGGKDDRSFNASAYEGAMKAKEELKAFLKYVEPTDHTSFEHLLRSFAQKKFDMIISVGVAQVEALKKVAAQYPNQRFTIIDGEVHAPNVRSFLFQEHEGSYLVGAIAALNAKKGVVGFIGGMDIPLVRRFLVGYTAGAKSIDPKIKVLTNYIGTTGDSWNNPARGKELALSQFAAGAEVIYGVAGASGVGIFDAAEETKKLAIGVDSNQNWMKPGYVLTSMVKRVDQAVLATCRDTAEGKFQSGTQWFSFVNRGVDYTVDRYNEKFFTPALRKKVETIKAEIIAGKIQVPDYYKQNINKSARD